MLGYCLSRDIDFSESKRRRMKYDRNSRRCPSFMAMHLPLCEGFVNLPVIDERIGSAVSLTKPLFDHCASNHLAQLLFAVRSYRARTLEKFAF